jgi:hypothetical protein
LGSDDNTLQTWYANNFEVGNNAFEFVIVFGEVYDGDGAKVWHGRVVSAPVPAKLLCDLLHRALEEYEREFGPIAAG